MTGSVWPWLILAYVAAAGHALAVGYHAIDLILVVATARFALGLLIAVGAVLAAALAVRLFRGYWPRNAGATIGRVTVVIVAGMIGLTLLAG